VGEHENWYDKNVNNAGGDGFELERLKWVRGGGGGGGEEER